MARRVYYIGNDVPRKVTVKNKSTGAAIDITGWGIRQIIKKNIDDTDAEAVYDSTNMTSLSDPTNGIHEWTIADSVSKLWTEGKYVSQYEFTISGNKSTSEIFYVEFAERIPDNA